MKIEEHDIDGKTRKVIRTPWGDFLFIKIFMGFIEFILIAIFFFSIGWHMGNIGPVIDQCNDHIYNEYIVGDGCKTNPKFNMSPVGVIDGYKHTMNKTTYGKDYSKVDQYNYNLEVEK